MNGNASLPAKGRVVAMSRATERQHQPGTPLSWDSIAPHQPRKVPVLPGFDGTGEHHLTSRSGFDSRALPTTSRCPAAIPALISVTVAQLSLGAYAGDHGGYPPGGPHPAAPPPSLGAPER